jgi:class 3 adenylate cyclase
MHRTLRTLLPNAVGTSQWVIAANIDIRGFSTYSLSRESVETALYLKKVYIAIIDGFFQFANVFYKPTGDGLFIVVPHDEPDFTEVATGVIEDALRLVDAFPTLTEGDLMLRFQVPDKIGIGISAGSASKMTSGRKTLDYSGRVLNQASRLMELARPSGVVFDQSIPATLLPTKVAARFGTDDVYLRGIAEATSISIHYLKGHTEILERSRQRLAEEVWARTTEEKTVRQLRDRGRFRHKLRYTPIDRAKIEIEVWHPKYRSGRRVRGVRSFVKPSFSYSTSGGQPIVTIDYPALVKHLKTKRVREADRVTIEIRYLRAKDPEAARTEADLQTTVQRWASLREAARAQVVSAAKPEARRRRPA